MGTIRWACKWKGLTREWDTEQIALSVCGGKKQTQRMLGGMLELRKVLTSELVKQVVFMSDELETPQSSIIFLVAWSFLLRVVAGAIPLEAGDESALMQMPTERHSSVWIDAAGQLCIRWTRRKHRPKGAIMRRSCMCAEVGPQCFVVCRMRPLLFGKKEWRAVVHSAELCTLQALEEVLGDASDC